MKTPVEKVIDLFAARTGLVLATLLLCGLVAPELRAEQAEETAEEAGEGAGGNAAKQPNIILILTDDQGYGDVGRHGHPLLKTPHMDRLYDESVRFDNFYVSPSCSPTRAALLTGMHEFRVGVTHTLIPREHLFKDAVILPQLLKTAGYSTAFIGKWHLGEGQGYSPEYRGFDLAATNPGGPGHHFDVTMVRNREPRRTETKGYREDVYFDEAMQFIDDCSDQPFFCYLATYSPHTPLAAPDEFIAPFREHVSEKHATYLGMVANLDYNLGRLVDFLEERELDEETIVIFMNDNGQTEGLDVYNAGMRGCKATVWEGGSRALSFWKWPGRWQAHTVDNLAAHLDVVPTLCELAGVTIPGDLQEQLEGFSLVSLLEAEEPLEWNPGRMLYHHVGRWPSGTAAAHRHAMAGVRKGHHLLIRSTPCDDPECEKHMSQCTTLRMVRDKGLKTTTYTEGNAQYHWGVTPADQWVLFDVKKDPGCMKNIADANPELVATMAASYDRWWDEMFPVMMERGGDAGSPDASAQASQKDLKAQEATRKAQEARKSSEEAPETQPE